jgi:hypothetical protein
MYASHLNSLDEVQMVSNLTKLLWVITFSIVVTIDSYGMLLSKKFLPKMNCQGMPACAIMHLTFSCKILFFPFTIPFCCGV